MRNTHTIVTVLVSQMRTKMGFATNWKSWDVQTKTHAIGLQPTRKKMAHVYASYATDCNGNCLVDTDGDGICEDLEVIGCSDAAACNYEPLATERQLVGMPLKGTTVKVNAFQT